MERIDHWIGGTARTRDLAAVTGPGLQPCHGRADARGRPRERRGGRRRGRERPGGVPRMARDLALQAGGHPVPRPRPDRPAPHGHRQSRERPARQGRLRRRRRGRARAGEHRVRVRDPAPAEGRLHRAGLDRRRRLLDPPAARRGRRASRRSTSRRWCPCGCSRTRSPAGTRSSSSPPRRIPGASLVIAELLQRGRHPRRRVHGAAGRQGRGRRVARASGREGALVRGIDADRALHLRDRAPATASGCRRSPGPRTTWSSCPTPTSRWRPTPRSRPPTGRPASAAWR